jgi:CheY-like chemotaxis protein
VLLVEDLVPVRAALARVLRQAGYQVVEAGSTSEALQALELCGGHVDLVIADVVMPGPSGVVLTPAKALWPLGT